MARGFLRGAKGAASGTRPPRGGPRGQPATVCSAVSVSAGLGGVGQCFGKTKPGGNLLGKSRPKAGGGGAGVTLNRLMVKLAEEPSEFRKPNVPKGDSVGGASER